MERKNNNTRQRLPHFFEIYISAVSSTRLKIPIKFVRHLEGRTSGLVVLEGPSGSTWHANLIQEDDELFLHGGWETFVKDHSIICGDLMVFRYNGNLSFSVQIFDQTACEKEAAFHCKCSQSHSSCNAVDQSCCSGVIYEAVPLKTRRDLSQSNSECIDKNQENKVYVCVDNCRGHEDVVGIVKHHDVLPMTDGRNRISKGDGFSWPSSSPICKSLSAEERKVARTFSSSFPYFVRIMKKFNVSGSYTLNIPYQFSMEHLPNLKITIVLRNIKGECWTVNSVPTTKVHTSHTLCGGWMAFVRANEIKLEDICVFELIGKCEMQVHILGASNGGFECQNGKRASNLLCLESSTASQEDYESTLNSKKRKFKTINSQILKKRLPGKKNIKVAQETASANRRKLGGALKSSIVQRNVSNAKAVGRVSIDKETRDCLSSMLSLHEERVARSFTSSFPKFVRIMKRFNISGSYTLKVPYQFAMAHLPMCKTEILLRNIKGECWTVNSVPDSQGRMSHTFCGGWLSFVRDNGVKLGDTCIFELIDKFEMLVHISEGGQQQIVPLALSTSNGH